MDESHSETTSNCNGEALFGLHSSPCTSEAVVPQFEEEQQQEQLICTAVQPKQQQLEDAYRASWAKDLDVRTVHRQECSLHCIAFEPAPSK